MTPEECHQELRALAAEVGLEVRAAGRGPEELAASGVCRVRGDVWVVLSASDPLTRRNQVLAEGLRTHAGAALEGRYLPPAIRALLEG